MSESVSILKRLGDLFIIGLDTEYVARGDANHILSYQWHVLYRGRESSGIALVDGVRMKLPHLLQRILEAAKADGLFDRYPRAVVVAAHYSLAEMVALADFDKLKTQLDGIRRTFASVKKPLIVKIRDRNGNTRPLSVMLRDTLLLTPQGAGLQELGEMHGLPKIELPEGAITRMDDLLRDDPELFTRYASRDAEIAARHALAMAVLNHELNGVCGVPISLGGMAIDFSYSTWKAEGIDALEVLGQVVERGEDCDPQTGRTRKTKATVLQAALHEHKLLATESYHGGRNEAFVFGATPPGEWIDVDLCGAYSTALSALGMPLWDQLRVTTGVDDYTPEILGFARLAFRFPAEVRFPCLPVRAMNNLIFPRTGETYATAPEIWLARRLGAELVVKHGVTIPMDDRVRPFRKVIEGATARRGAAKAVGDSLRDKLFKELANSLYGKTAQGLREKRALNTRLGKTAPMPASKITNPFIAAAVTGAIRAVLAEMMNAVPVGQSVVSVTTDGFITDVPESDLQTLYGQLCAAFGAARQGISDDPHIIEVKNRVAQVLCWRTRGQATITDQPAENLILAKAGFKPPRGLDKAQQNELMLDLFRDREVTTTYAFKNLRSMSKIYRKGGDLVSEDCLRRLRMDYDWKRRPVSSRTTEIQGYPHLAFDTEPWNSVDQFIECRDQWQRFQQESGRCLKSVGDLEAFIEYAAGARLTQHGLNRSVRGGIAAQAVKQFLRAFVRNQWGLSAASMSYAELAEFLRTGGFEVKVNTVKNAARPGAKLVAGVVPRNGGVLAFVNYVMTRFPGFDAEQMLTPSDEVGSPSYAKPEKRVGKPRMTPTSKSLVSSGLHRRCTSPPMGMPDCGKYTAPSTFIQVPRRDSSRSPNPPLIAANS